MLSTEVNKTLIYISVLDLMAKFFVKHGENVKQTITRPFGNLATIHNLSIGNLVPRQEQKT
jgi:hypothetical protein